MGTMPAFFEMLMPVSPPVKLMQFTAGCVCRQTDIVALSNRLWNAGGREKNR